jgi:hypothetical protein
MTPLAHNRIPASVNADHYEDVPEDCRGEAMARMAWLVIRGASPAVAFDAALRGMTDDEMVQERLPSWEAVRVACGTWPRAGRLADGTPVDGAFQLALAMDAVVAAAIEGSDVPEHRAAWLRPLCPNERAVGTVLAWIAARIVALTPLAVTEEEEWDRPEEVPPAAEPAHVPVPYAWKTDDHFGFPDD